MDITVIVPVYNGEQTIERAILSVVKQKVSEILIVDDGSDDNTSGLLATIQNNFPIIRVIHEEHKGVSEARNAGIREAKSEWLMFLDADDWLSDTAISTLMGCSGSETDACCGGIIRGNRQKHTQYMKSLPYHFFTDTHELLNYAMEEPTDRLTIHGWIIRKNICTKNNIFFSPNLRYGEDSEFMLRLLATCRQVVFTDEPVYYYFISPVSTTNKWQSGKTEEYLRTLEEIKDTEAGYEENWSIFVLTTLLLLLTHVIFHPANPDRRKKQLQEAKRIRMIPVFEDAFNSVDLEKMSIKKRTVLKQLKANRIILTYLAVRIRQWQNRYYASRCNGL